MRRRQRRLFNLFAFSLLGTAIYLNVFRMNDTDIVPVNKSLIVRNEIKPPVQGNMAVKILPKPEHKK